MMQQRTLFDTPPAIARRRDPQTSKQAAREVEPKLGRLQSAMLDVWKTRAATANEAAAACVDLHGGMHESYRKRAKELVTRGLIEPAGEPRECTFSGRPAQPYHAKD